VNRLLEPKYRLAVEKAVSESLGECFSVSLVRENRVSAMHDAAFFEGTLGARQTPYRVFVKLGTNPFSPEQFAMEAKGLDYIRAHSSVRTPLVIAVADTLQIPVKFVGVGEQMDDLMPFEAKGFVEALL
jgi:hypothetical protein